MYLKLEGGEKGECPLTAQQLQHSAAHLVEGLAQLLSNRGLHDRQAGPHSAEAWPATMPSSAAARHHQLPQQAAHSCAALHRYTRFNFDRPSCPT